MTDQTKELIPESQKTEIMTQQLRIMTQVKTYEDITLAKSMRLEKISEIFGEDVSLGLVIQSLSELCSAMSFETTPEMILLTAQMILSDFPDTKLAALHIFKKEVLYGRIGKPGKTFRMDAKVLLEFWSEFYVKMTNTIADYIEAKGKEFFPPDKPVDKDKIVPMPDYVKENLERLSQKLIKEKKEADENRPKPQTKKTLDEIAFEQGIDPKGLAEIIKVQTKRVFDTGEVKISYESFLAMTLGRITFEARKRPGMLHEYIKLVKNPNP